MKLRVSIAFSHWWPEELGHCGIWSEFNSALSSRAKNHEVMLLRPTELSIPEKQQVPFWARSASTLKAEHLDLPSPK